MGSGGTAGVWIQTEEGFHTLTPLESSRRGSQRETGKGARERAKGRLVRGDHQTEGEEGCLMAREEGNGLFEWKGVG